MDGAEKIIGNEDFNKLGYPKYEESSYVLGQYVIIPEIDYFLVVDPKSPELQRQRKTPYHGHGYLPEHPRMYPALLLSGKGIRKGQRIGLVRNQDVAPTIAHILGLSMAGMEGRVLQDALENDFSRD